MFNRQFGFFAKTTVAAAFILICAAPVIVSAAQVTLQWDANSSTAEGFKLYQRISGQSYDYIAPVWTGAAATYTVTGLTEGVTYHFVVRAFNGNDQSDDSNEVQYTPAVAPAQNPDDNGGGQADELDAVFQDNTDVTDAQGADLDNNSDASQTDGNTAPNRPMLALPVTGAQGVALAPTFRTGSFTDADGDTHAQTRYQISTTADFSGIVFDRTYAQHLTGLTLPELVLDAETTYFWRVKFIDARNGASQWSQAFEFETLTQAETGDANGNGIADNYELDENSDLDQDGTPDVNQAGLMGVTTNDALNPRMAVKRISENAQIVSVHPVDAALLTQAVNQPEQISAVIGFKLHLLNEAATATIAVYFSQPAPDNALWYKYDPADGWSVYPQAVFSDDRRYVTLVLEDGGIGDQDGIRNGIIIDPAGLGYSTQAVDADIDTVSADGGSAGGSGCFINTAEQTFAGFYQALLIATLFPAAAIIRVRARR